MQEQIGADTEHPKAEPGAEHGPGMLRSVEIQEPQTHAAVSSKMQPKFQESTLEGHAQTELKLQRALLEKQLALSENASCCEKLAHLESHVHEIWCAFLALQAQHEDLQVAHASFQRKQGQGGAVSRPSQQVHLPDRPKEVGQAVLEDAVISLERVELEEQVRELRQSIAFVESSEAWRHKTVKNCSC